MDYCMFFSQPVTGVMMMMMIAAAATNPAIIQNLYHPQYGTKIPINYYTI